MNDKVEYLTPENTKIEEGEFETLNIFLKNGMSYKGVFAVSCFPIKEPTKFISLFHQTQTGEIEEIGIIKDILDFPEEDRLRETGISFRRDKKGNRYIEEKDVKNFLKSQFNRENLTICSYWTI